VAVDDAVQTSALSGLAAETAACAGRRIARADQLQGDSDRMWAIYMTSPNPLTAAGYRSLQLDSGTPTPPR